MMRRRADGLSVYRFIETVEPTRTQDLQMPGNLVNGDAKAGWPIFVIVHGGVTSKRRREYVQPCQAEYETLKNKALAR